MNEQTAKSLYCPFARDSCKASLCMFWRVSQKLDQTGQPYAYCGLPYAFQPRPPRPQQPGYPSPMGGGAYMNQPTSPPPYVWR